MERENLDNTTTLPDWQLKSSYPSAFFVNKVIIYQTAKVPLCKSQSEGARPGHAIKSVKAPVE